jgi:hypothetical protein
VADLSSTIASFYTGTYNVTRAGGPGTYVDGVWTPAVDSVIAMQAGVYPLNGRALQRLPEGRRTGDVREVFTIAELRVSAPGQAADKIEIDGAAFEVEIVENWQASGNFYRSIVRKEPE